MGGREVRWILSDFLRFPPSLLGLCLRGGAVLVRWLGCEFNLQQSKGHYDGVFTFLVFITLSSLLTLMAPNGRDGGSTICLTKSIHTE